MQVDFFLVKYNQQSIICFQNATRYTSFQSVSLKLGYFRSYAHIKERNKGSKKSFNSKFIILKEIRSLLRRKIIILRFFLLLQNSFRFITRRFSLVSRSNWNNLQFLNVDLWNLKVIKWTYWNHFQWWIALLRDLISFFFSYCIILLFSF